MIKFKNVLKILGDMEIEDKNWNSFHIPIPFREGESDEAYIERVRGCLDTFYRKYTQNRGLIENRNPLRNTLLNVERNFCEMFLNGIDYCDVKFFVNSPEDNYGREGIDVLSHSDRREWREPMIDFVRERWKEFEYSFD